ncbi:MAG: serine/threonine protein kinase [Myxococcaceae bacterium]|nr:serine/threonine protein kinase [Myxococcaceae bacterium]
MTDDDFPDLTGRRIGDYDMIDRIGVGGMGVVYEGKHPVIGKRVAVKFLLPALSKDKELVARFVAEARAVNAIGHRGIVDIFNFGTLDDGTQYFVMEFLDGRPFDQVIAAEAPMHPALAVRYLEEILDALKAAHDCAVIHRDIKPSNIFLVESGGRRPYVKLLDFGIAKTNAKKTGSTPQTRQSVVIGTPEYIAPEQAQGREISAATDLYAVGCMAFELLTGRLPFKGDNPLDTMFKHVIEPTPHVRSFAPNVPLPLDELVFKLMQKRPEDRPASTADVLKSLELLRGAMTIDASQSVPSQQGATRASAPITGAERTVPSRPLPLVPGTHEALSAVRPSPLRYVVLGALVLVAMGLTAYAIVSPRPAGEPTPIVAPPPPKVVRPALEVHDAGVAAAVEPKEPPPPPALPPPTPAPTPAPSPPVRRGISSSQLKGRIAALEKKLEQREAARGEALPVLRSFLKQARDDAAKASSDGDRREVWSFLDDVARQIDR